MELKRKELVTYPAIQAKWVGIILALVAAGAILVYVSIDRAILQAGASADQIFLTGDWIRQRIQTPFYVASLLSLLAAGVVALYQLHALLGPLKALEAALLRFQQGDLKDPFHIREADDLQDLASGVRAMQEGLKVRILKDREKARTLKTLVDEAAGKLTPAQAQLQQDLLFVSKELETLTSQFEI